MTVKKIIILFCLLCLPLSALAQETPTEPEKITRPVIKIFDSETFALKNQIYPFGPDSQAQGLNLTTADINKDGFKEIIVATGRNEKPFVKIYNHLGEFQYQFLAYDASFTKGFKIIAADLFKDGSPEIIVSPNEGGSAQIRIFDNLGFIYYSFFAFEEKLRGGADIAAGDVNGDSQIELIVGAGTDQEPRVKIYDNYSNLLTSFLAYENNFKGGVAVKTADFDNNNVEEIITGPYQDKEAQIKIFDYNGKLADQFLAYPAGFIGGVNLTIGDINQDKTPEIITGPGFGGDSHIRFFNSTGEAIFIPKFFAFTNFKGGVSVATGDINNDGKPEILTASQIISPIDKYEAVKIIEINLNKQKMFTFYKGLPEKEFWISTGTWKYPTPKGVYKVNNKIVKKTMVGNYGPNNPDNYNLPNVPNVMYFYKGYAIHGAYWHFKFGTRVSHGCVNMRLKDAEWLYNWTPLNTYIKIY